MHKFVLNLITEWRRLELPAEGETVVVAVSGGADSISLLWALEHLRILKKLDLRFVAAHFNHKLRGGESDRDEEFVKTVAGERDIELSIGHGSIETQGNLEQNARVARYEFLAGTAENLHSRSVLTAHTMNDQAETFLMNLIRGSGPDGLGGMKPVRNLRDQESRVGEMGRKGEWEKESIGPADPSTPLLPFSPIFLVRPLLRWASRSDTENYCRESGVEFRYDTMNEDMSFKRVRVRKMLLPMLKEFNPNIIETLARTAELMQTASETPEIAAQRQQDIEAELSIQYLKDLESADLHKTLRSWLKVRRGSLRSISLKHIEAVERLIHSTKSGRTVELPGFGLVRKQDGRISFTNIKVDN